MVSSEQLLAALVTDQLSADEAAVVVAAVQVEAQVVISRWNFQMAMEQKAAPYAGPKLVN